MNDSMTINLRHRGCGRRCRCGCAGLRLEGAYDLVRLAVTGERYVACDGLLVLHTPWRLRRCHDAPLPLQVTATPQVAMQVAITPQVAAWLAANGYRELAEGIPVEVEEIA